MSVETGFLDIGFLVSDNDFRNSTITGTTLSGPNGSGQFLFVKCSTVNNFAISLCTSTTLPVLGVLQNKPSTGIGADVKVFGVSKVVAATTFAVGTRLMLSATSTGAVIAFTSTAGFAVGQALEAPAAVGAVFSAYIYGGGVGGAGWLLGA